jgi:hypothetical protein
LLLLFPYKICAVSIGLAELSVISCSSGSMVKVKATIFCYV